MEKRKIYEAIKARRQKENKVVSALSDSTRLYVIEATIYIEELISEALGLLLGFESKTSSSLGSKSISLSFNQKVTIIQDMKNVEKSMVQKMNCLMQIRNKFAHVSQVDNFEAFFDNSSSGKSVKKELDKWYKPTLENDKNNYIDLFNELVDDIITFLFQITGDHFYNVGLEEGKHNFRLNLLDSLIKEIVQIDGGKEFVKNVMNKVEKGLNKEE